MFVIHCRKLIGDGMVWGKWFNMWRSDDGKDCADYLRQLVEDRRKGVEYRMLFVLED